MPMYAIATVPLIKQLNQNVNQVWYAVDATAMGLIEHVRLWWYQLVKLGPGSGYYTNAIKPWLITKDAHHKKAIETFDGTRVKVTLLGRPYLGTHIGTRDFIQSFVADKVNQWSAELDVLTSFAKPNHMLHIQLTPTA